MQVFVVYEVSNDGEQEAVRGVFASHALAQNWIKRNEIGGVINLRYAPYHVVEA